MALARHELYRSFLKHLRRVPDPHVWSVVVPRFRQHLKEPAPLEALSTHSRGDVAQLDHEQKRDLLREERRRRGLISARKELRRLQAAVSCQPHALTRLLEEAYGLRGAVRWQLLNHVKATSPQNAPAFEWIRPQISLPDLPDALHPLRPKHVPSAKTESRLRPVPNTAVRKAGRDKWTHEWANVRVPLVLPQVDERHGQTGFKPSTGWEGRGLVEAFRTLAGLKSGMYAESTLQANTDGGRGTAHLAASVKPHDLATFSALSPRLQRLFPKRASASYADLPTYPVPPPRATRQNPRTWRAPRRLRPRLVRRIYRLLWDKLVWVKPVHRHSARLGGASQPGPLPARLAWEKCTYDEMRAYEAGQLDGGKFRGVTRVEPPSDKYSTIRPEDTQWL